MRKMMLFVVVAALLAIGVSQSFAHCGKCGVGDDHGKSSCSTDACCVKGQDACCAEGAECATKAAGKCCAGKKAKGCCPSTDKGEAKESSEAKTE